MNDISRQCRSNHDEDNRHDSGEEIKEIIEAIEREIANSEKMAKARAKQNNKESEAFFLGEANGLRWALLIIGARIKKKESKLI